MRSPAELYRPSNRPYRGLPELDYPLHDKIVTVTTCGRICYKQRKINLSTVFAGHNVGIKQTEDRSSRRIAGKRVGVHPRLTASHRRPN
jgi:putative transposase